jgi:DNA repair exonuclease SbcCD ATPase subunit
MSLLTKSLAAVVDAIIPPSFAELTDRLRTARTELAEARKITPKEPDGFLGRPDAHLVAASIACCEKAMKARDNELAFRQGDTESGAIFAALAETLDAKASEACKLKAAFDAAKEALDTFDRRIHSDVEDAEAQLRALSARRRAEELPVAWALPCDGLRPSSDLRSLLGDRDLTKAAELLRRCPVLGRDPSQGDLIQARINEIRRLDTERETKRALAAKPYWEDHDGWVSKWLSKDRTGRDEMEERGRELRAKASRY